ncbi:MAG: pyruvate formate-lyase activating enzyme [Deltaproteobacteria bacterium]|nr:pyruvate formate-lyase activating enzyme [Deltaproteobacteria bacterium]
MNRFLIVDVGAGTMDVLCYDMGSDEHYKAVVKSPIRTLAEAAENLPGNLLITGTEMGGGELSVVLERRSKKDEVIMSASAAATIHHNPEKVRSLGIKIVDDNEIANLQRRQAYHMLRTCDLEVDRLEEIVKGLGIPLSFDVVGLCAQDHGRAPDGMSHLDYRHQIFKAGLDENPFLHGLLYRDDEIPASLSRLKAMAESAKMLSADEIYVMDSGMAAILGASMDWRVREKKRTMVLDVATSHTVAAALDRGEMAGFFEYHTKDITLERLEALLEALADGRLNHEEILKEGGHGAYIRKALGFRIREGIVATGPKRRLVEQSRLPILFGSPLGDNMMTGTVGVLEAIRRRKGLRAISFL